MNPREVKLLLVEDNEGDIILTLEALKDGKLKNAVSVVRDGEEAIQFLNKKGEFEQAVRPDLILLDINLPKIDGLEVLTFIKTHPDLKTIPVVMLTTSSAQSDVYNAYAKYANCYITKPVDFSKFMEVVGSIEDFWVSIVQLPPQT